MARFTMPTSRCVLEGVEQPAEMFDHLNWNVNSSDFGLYNPPIVLFKKVPNIQTELLIPPIDQWPQVDYGKILLKPFETGEISDVGKMPGMVPNSIRFSRVIVYPG